MSNINGKEIDHPGAIFVEGRGWVDLRQWCMKSYYYRVMIPSNIARTGSNTDAGMTIGLFCDHIGDKEWTNFARERMLPEGHEAVIYRVSLVARPERHTFLIDVMTALQLGHLTISTEGEEFISEPLSFFACNLFGEMASREKDPLARLAIEIHLATTEGGEFTDAAKRIVSKTTGIEMPCLLQNQMCIDGHIDLKKELSGLTRKPFGLYVVLHTITQKPLR